MADRKVIEKILKDAKKAKLSDDTIATLLEDVTSKGAQPDTLSPYQQLLMEGAVRDVRKSSQGTGGTKKRTDMSRDTVPPKQERTLTEAVPDATRVVKDLTFPKGDSGFPAITDPAIIPRSGLHNFQGQANQMQLEDLARNISVRGGEKGLPPILELLGQAGSKEMGPPKSAMTKDGKERKEKDPNAPGTIEKLLPYLGLASLIGAVVAKHNEGPKTTGTTVQNLQGGGRMLTTQQQGPQLSDALFGGAAVAGQTMQAQGEKRAADQQMEMEQQQIALENELAIRKERQATAALLMKAGLKEPAVGMIQMDNPELGELDFSKMTGEQEKSERREALEGLMKPSVYTRLDPDVQETVMRDYFDVWGMSMPSGAFLVAREDPSKAMPAALVQKMLTMGIMLPDAVLNSHRIPKEQAQALVEMSHVSRSADEKKLEFQQLAQLSRMMESAATITVDPDALLELENMAAAIVPRLSKLSKELGYAQPVPADFGGLPTSEAVDMEEPMEVDEAIDLLRDPSLRNRSRAEHERALRAMGVDMSDPRILNELEALEE